MRDSKLIPLRRWLALLLVAVFASVAAAQDKQEAPVEPKVEMLSCSVLVLDPDGNPVEDATIYCTGMRTKQEPGSHWGWNPKEHGTLPKLKTNSQGIVEMPYPKYVSEKLDTGQMTWSVEHPDFVSFREDRNVADDPAEIKLARGVRIAVTAVDGTTGEQIKEDLYAVIGGSRADWKLAKNGMLVSPVFAKDDTSMRVCQLIEGQPALFSENIKIEPGDRSRILLKGVKLNPGTRVEGKLDESIVRPVKNGHVSASIVRKTGANSSWKTRWNWSDKTPIKEDGTFVFESLPPDEVLQMVPVCDGWVPAKPKAASVLKFFPNNARNLKGHLTIPQIVELKGEKVSTILNMKKATSVKVTVQAPDGEPLPGADVVMWPNQLWFDSGTQILGDGYSQAEILIQTRAGGFDFDRTMRFKSVTDEKGVAVINNLPVDVTEEIAVMHKDFDMPIAGDERSITVDLKANAVAEITIKMQKKGVDALGEQSEEEKQEEKQTAADDKADDDTNNEDGK